MAVRTKLSSPVQYENFEPKYERKEEEGASLILIHLPGFQKEQIKITYVHSTRMISVTGEKPLISNKWSRFNEAFPVPLNCDVNKIDGRFVNGVLTITFPKPIIKAPKTTPTTTPTPQLAPSGAASATPGKEGNGKAWVPKTSQKDTTEPKAQKGGEGTANFLGKQTEGKKTEGFSPQEVPKEQKPQKGQDDTAPQKGGLLAEDKESNKRRKESMEVKNAESGDHKLGRSGEGKARKEEGSSSMGERLEEKREAVVNIGVAVMVIVALGAYYYLSHGHGSSSSSSPSAS